MVSITTIIESLLIGIALITAINHLILALTISRPRLHLSFSVLAFLVSLYALLILLTYYNGSVVEQIELNRWATVIVALFFMLLPWYVRFYTGIQATVVPIIFNVMALVFLIATLTLPYGLSLSSIDGIKLIALPWGESITRLVGTESQWSVLGHILVFSILIYCHYLVVLQYRHGDRKAALFLFFAFIIYTASIVVNTLVRAEVFQFTLTGSYGNLMFILVMSWFMSSQLRGYYRQISLKEQQLRWIMDSTDAVIYLKDKNGGYVLINKRYEELFNVTQDQLKGKNDRQIFPEELADKLIRNDIAVMQQGHQMKLEEVVTQEDGEHTYISLKVPLRDEKGEIYGICGISTDITDRKRMENELVNQKVMLDKKVEERTRELQRLVSELDAFGYAVSHDLRTPLRALYGFSSILLEDYENKLDQQGQDYLHRITNASKRMDKMIDALIGLSRIQRNQMDIQKINLTTMAHEIIDDLRHGQPERQVGVLVENDLEVTGDVNLIRLVVDNLLSNAWKYTQHSNNPKIEMGRQIQDGQDVIFVKDNGAGFNMKDIDKLIVPFQRLHSDDEFQGTGIGLSTVNRVISRHQGKFWAEGEPGKGATFYFTLDAKTES